MGSAFGRGMANLTQKPFARSKPTREQQYDKNNQDDANNTNAAVTVAVSVSTEATAEAAQQKYDDKYDEYEAD
jgi:hypothetical protein